MNRKVIGFLSVVGLSVGFLAGGCDDPVEPEPDLCDGVTALILNAPVVGATVTAGQATTISWCYGDALGVKIFFEDEDQNRIMLNPDPSRQVSDVTSITWTPTAAMVGPGYIIIENYNDGDKYVEAQITVVQ